MCSPTVEAPRVRPGDEVRGAVRIASAGRPVAGADVTVWAVDDALLALGEWKAPDIGCEVFYPSPAASGEDLRGAARLRAGYLAQEPL